MAAAWWLWVRTDARRRVRPALVLAVLVALAGGVVMTAVAGGRRNGTAVERATALTSPADAVALPNEPGFDWDAVRDLPEVEAVGEFPVTFYVAEGLPPDVDPSFPPGSPEAATEIEVPIVVEGRLADPRRVDEVVVAPDTARRAALEVGDRLTLRTLTPEEAAAVFSGSGEPTVSGPRQPVTVVGIVKGSFFADSLTPTHAFFERYRENLVPPGAYVNAVIRLRRGAADVPALRRHVAELAGHPVEVWDRQTEEKRETNATHLERDALYGFAAAAALAALVLVGQAVVRMVAASLHEVPLLTTLGFTRGGAAAAVGALPAAAGVAGAGLAAAVAYLLSERFPIGVGRRAEPNPGFHLDWAVIGPGMAATAAVAGGGALALAALAVRRQRAAPPAGSRLAARVAATSAPVPLAMGVRLALERGNGRTAVPVRPALVGSVVGVLGVVAALTFAAGLDRATTDASLYGQTYDAELFALESPLPPEVGDALAAEPEVEMVTEIRNSILRVNGREVSVTGARPVSGELGLRPVRGRLPTAPDEIALAPQEMDALGVDVGDHVRVIGAGAGGARGFTVTAEAFSVATGHTQYDAGAQVTAEAMRRLAPAEEDLKFHAYLARFTAGTDARAAIDRLNEELGLSMEPRPPVEDQENLKGVRQVPVALGAFLAVLAVGAVGHALASTVRRRRHDVAVLRALGITRRQARATVAWQATTLALVGLIFGVPLGVAVGRTVWRAVAEQTPLLYVAPFALVAVLAVPPVAVAVANALAAWPGHVAARLRPAETLRAE